LNKADLIKKSSEYLQDNVAMFISELVLRQEKQASYLKTSGNSLVNQMKYLC